MGVSVKSAPMSSEDAAEYLTQTYGVPFMWADVTKACRNGNGPAFTSYNRQMWFQKTDLDAWAELAIKRAPMGSKWHQFQATHNEMDILEQFRQSYEEGAKELGLVTEIEEKEKNRDNVLKFNGSRGELFTFRCSPQTKTAIGDAAEKAGCSIAEYMEGLIHSAATPRNLRDGDGQRTKQFNFRCTPEVHRAIHWLSRQAGMSSADLLEELVLCEAEQQDPASCA